MVLDLCIKGNVERGRVGGVVFLESFVLGMVLGDFSRCDFILVVRFVFVFGCLG